MDFRNHTVVGLAAEVATGRRSAVELATGALDRIEEHNPAINAFVAVDRPGALGQAAAVDAAVAAGERVGPLAGIPIGVKDLEDAAGLRTTHGCALYATAPPAERDSVFVSRLRAAGCVVVGKTNTPETGYMADTVNPLFGATRNPWDLARSAGGSSGGSAAAVAAGMVPLATGSDGGGSIRIPSALCGLTGFKPSLGRVPVGGVEPPAWADLSTKGPIARRARDLAAVLDATIGPDPTDLRSLPMPSASWSASLDELGLPRTVGWAPTLGYARVDSEVAGILAAAVTALEALGIDVVDVDPVFDHDPVGAWLTLVTSADLARFAGLSTAERALLDPGHDALMLTARDRSATDVVTAQTAGHQANLRLVEVFHQVGLLLCPTVAGQAGPVGEWGLVDGEPDANWVACTYPFNLTRSPAGTVWVGSTRAGLPVGLQVVGPQHADVAVLRMLALVEDELTPDVVAPL